MYFLLFKYINMAVIIFSLHRHERTGTIHNALLNSTDCLILCTNLSLFLAINHAASVFLSKLVELGIIVRNLTISLANIQINIQILFDICHTFEPHRIIGAYEMPTNRGTPLAITYKGGRAFQRLPTHHNHHYTTGQLLGCC